MAPTVKKSCTCGPLSCGGGRLAELQAPCTVCLRPAMWTNSCSERGWAKVVFTISFADGTETKAPNRQTIIKALSMAEAENRNFTVKRNDGNEFRAFFFTPYYQWIDLVQGSISEGDAGKSLLLTLTSASTAACPSSCACAPCGSCAFGLFCPCVIIEDGGKNLEHLMALKDILVSEGMNVQQNIDVWGCADRENPIFMAPTAQKMEGRGVSISGQQNARLSFIGSRSRTSSGGVEAPQGTVTNALT